MGVGVSLFIGCAALLLTVQRVLNKEMW